MLKRLCRLPPRRSALLLGPRQTGKSTLVRSLLPRRSWSVDLLRHDVFLRYSKEPERFRLEAEAQIRAGVRVVFVDEIQRVPGLLEEIHGLIETHRIRFLLTGSSARKLRRGAANLLAGRAATRRLHPLTLAEQGERFDLERTLRYGSLPAVVTGSARDARDLLASYAETYLREEVQAEALVRNLGGFARFLDVVAAENGGIVNASAVARDAALAPRTVQEYYQILEDTLIGLRIEPWRHSPRARLVGHPRFYLFDTGVTNALARRLGAPPTRSGAGACSSNGSCSSARGFSTTGRPRPASTSGGHTAERRSTFSSSVTDACASPWRSRPSGRWWRPTSRGFGRSRRPTRACEGSWWRRWPSRTGSARWTSCRTARSSNAYRG